MTSKSDKETLITLYVLSATALFDAQADKATKDAVDLAALMTPQEVYVCQQLALILTQSSSNDHIKP